MFLKHHAVVLIPLTFIMNLTINLLQYVWVSHIWISHVVTKMFYETILWNFHHSRTFMLSKLRENTRSFGCMHPLTHMRVGSIHTHMRIGPTLVGPTLMWVWGYIHPKHLILPPKLARPQFLVMITIQLGFFVKSWARNSNLFLFSEMKMVRS